ncbi:MAG: hypothetical protein ACK56F_05230, partial [bacterium]
MPREIDHRKTTRPPWFSETHLEAVARRNLNKNSRRGSLAVMPLKFGPYLPLPRWGRFGRRN